MKNNIANGIVDMFVEITKFLKGGKHNIIYRLFQNEYLKNSAIKAIIYLE